MGILKNMPTAGLVVIVVILALFLLAVCLLIHISLRYRFLSARAGGDGRDARGFLHSLLEGYRASYLRFGEDVNTPAIISDVLGARLGGLMLCERFLNNAVSLFVTLGLFGTFLGLSLSVASLTELIGFSNTSEWLSVLDSVGGGLMSALSGMGVAFYTSLVGAGCSIVLTVLRTILNPQTAREKFETRLELWLDTGVAPTLKTQAAKSDAALVRQMIDALNATAAEVRQSLGEAAASYGRALEVSREQIAAFDRTIEKFNGGVRDFSEVDYNLRGSVERMDLAVRDLSSAMREINRRMEGEGT
jgi:hypothetical protein